MAKKKPAKKATKKKPAKKATKKSAACKVVKVCGQRRKICWGKKKNGRTGIVSNKPA